MLAPARRCSALFAAFLCLSAALLRAQEGEFARNLPPELSFTENYADEVKSFTEDGWTDYWTAPDAKSKFKVTAKVSAQGIPLEALNGDSLFSFSIGDFAIEGKLSDDPKYTPGATSIRIPLMAYDDDKEQDFVAGSVVIAWTPTAITLTAEASAPETYSILSSNYLASNETIEDTTSCFFEFAENTLDRTVYFRGKATAITKTVGRGDSETEVELSTVKLTGEIDSVAPTVAITSPAKDAITGADLVAVAGTVSDNVAVAEVRVQVNNGESRTAIISGGGWNLADVPLALGANTLRVQAVDLDGNESAATSVVNRWTPLTVEVAGAGTVTKDFLGSTLREPGAAVTLKAKASAGYIFAGWTGSVTSSETTVSFVVAPGMKVTASFIPLPFGALVGRYSGLIHSPADQPAGPVQVQLNNKGTFTAQFTLGNRKTKLKGAFDATGRFVGTLPRKGMPSLRFDLTLDIENGSETITGTITEGANEWTLHSDHTVYSTANPFPRAGTYTALFRAPKSGAPGVPQNDGWASVKIRPDGKAKMVGMLGDGSAFSTATIVLKDGAMPFYFSAKASGATLGGTLRFKRNNPVKNDFEGTLTWSQDAKAGTNFQTELEVSGVKYNPAQALGLQLPTTHDNAEITLAGGDLNAEVRKLVTILPNGVVTASADSGLKLRLKLSAGTFAGSFRKAGGAPVKFRGVILQGRFNYGVGIHWGQNTAGSVVIVPVEMK